MERGAWAGMVVMEGGGRGGVGGEIDEEGKGQQLAGMKVEDRGMDGEPRRTEKKKGGKESDEIEEEEMCRMNGKDGGWRGLRQSRAQEP
ncbi:hypothetical protein VZT92_021337 [Zoarces viviparus]|uniref:Uncharacterized protein n=1 Tax=Zoarces viviparus TaxID=48416 RepID=A0AAW1EDG0_ZOAVI